MTPTLEGAVEAKACLKYPRSHSLAGRGRTVTPQFLSGFACCSAGTTEHEHVQADSLSHSLPLGLLSRCTRTCSWLREIALSRDCQVRLLCGSVYVHTA